MSFLQIFKSDIYCVNVLLLVTMNFQVLQERHQAAIKSLVKNSFVLTVNHSHQNAKKYMHE